MARSRSTNEMHQSQYSKAELNLLIRIARDAISRQLGKKPRLSRKELVAYAGRHAEKLMQKRGAFVTLTIGGKLRGCIGSIFAEAPLLHAVYDNALNAAFSDPRFLPLSKNEYEKISIEVSVLSPLSKLEYSDSVDLLSKLSPHRHGVLLKFSNGSGSTFLPQVWEQLPRKEEFISHLCAKAGMRPDAWRTLKPDVLVYSVQSAEEPDERHVR